MFIFISLGFTPYTPRRGLAGSCGNSVFDLLRNCQTFPQQPHHFHSHQQCERFQFLHMFTNTCYYSSLLRPSWWVGGGPDRGFDLSCPSDYYGKHWDLRQSDRKAPLPLLKYLLPRWWCFGGDLTLSPGPVPILDCAGQALQFPSCFSGATS